MRSSWWLPLLLLCCSSVTYQQVIVDGHYVERISIEQQELTTFGVIPIRCKVARWRFSQA